MCICILKTLLYNHDVNYVYFMYIYVFEAHMEDWETKCVASLNKDFTYLLTYLLTYLQMNVELFHKYYFM
jgi:hypothetical protein